MGTCGLSDNYYMHPHLLALVPWVKIVLVKLLTCYTNIGTIHRGGSGGPAGTVLAGPLFENF